MAITTITKVFKYTGKLQIAHIPIGVASIDVYLWGGAGGSGGSDYAGEGADAAAGQYVTATGIDMSAYAGKKSMVVAVGGGAGGGSSGTTAQGGINGKGMTGYSGGTGGKSGTFGTSGSGGGGGGATTITLYESGQTLDNIKIAIAGGGGGAGGSGMASRGGAGLNTNSATAHTPGYLGENGAKHTGDGAGGGGAGGGNKAGKGGSGNIGDMGGYAGYSGGNLVPAGGTSNSGSGLTPQQTPTSVLGYTAYTNPLAIGGAEGHAGKDGLAIVVFNIPAEGFFKVGGTWKKMPTMKYKVAGVWKKLIGGYTKVSGVWKALFSGDVIFTSMADGFGDIGGASTSGTDGTGGTPVVENVPASAPPHQAGGGQGDGIIPSEPSYVNPHEATGNLPTGQYSPQVPSVGQYQWNPSAKYGFYDKDDGTSSTGSASNYSGPIGGGGSCFIAGTKVRMADGTDKNIEDIIVGDIVKGKNGDNKVIALDPTVLSNRKLYAFNDSENYFFTSEHPFMTEEGWKSIKPEKTKERDGVELYDQLKGELKVGDKLVMDSGLVEITEIKSKEINDPDMPLYNFHVSNDNLYIADGHVVHNKGCFIAGTPITMADGSTKPVEEVTLRDQVAVGGFVFGCGKFLVNDLYDYKGIKVSGSHMVKENTKWIRVLDSELGKSLGPGDHTVYVFGCENRRILINDTLFTDYFDGFEQKGLEKLGEEYFSEYHKTDEEIAEQVVDLINKK
jgi:hypothetical protein